jgi:DNA-binding MarR family transcriptional regulator
MAFDVDRELLTLARLARLLEHACGDVATEPLTLPQYRLLAMIADGSDRASHLAGLLALGKPTVSATVDTLVERGLVARTVAPDDRRVVRLAVTGAGRSALRQAQAAMRARVDDVIAHVDDPAPVHRTLAVLGDGLDQRRAERRAARARP